MSNDIVEVPFNGSEMIAQKSDDGEICVALKPICENIGIWSVGTAQQNALGNRSYDTNGWC